MEEKELTQQFQEVFEITLPILESARKAFLTDKDAVLKENLESFRKMMRNRVTNVEKIFSEKEKDAVERRYINLVPPAQAIALGLENLLHKMETKVRWHILFSEKALMEIRNLYGIMESQLRNTKDYLITRNPHLLSAVRDGMEHMTKVADEYSVIHQERLISGICVPEASYLYIDMTDSFKRITKALVEFAEKV
jgi:Na+/phosphate symporter